MGILSGFFAPAAGAGISFSALESAKEKAREAGRLGQTLANQYGQQAIDQTQFRPFTVSTRTGSVNTDPSGGFSTSLNPEQAAAQSQLFGQGTGMLSGLGNTNQRTQELFSLLNNIRQPEIGRQRLGLEERLFNQGRTGLQTSQFGGSPEQFAMEKAIQEQQSQDLFMARQQAQQEEQQQYEVGTGLFDQSYVPERELLSFLQPGVMLSDIGNTSQRTGASLNTTLQQSGLQSLLGGEDLAQTINAKQIEALSQFFANMSKEPKAGSFLAKADSAVDDLLGGLLDRLFPGGTPPAPPLVIPGTNIPV